MDAPCENQVVYNLILFLSQLQNMVTERVSPDGNVTVSTLMFIPSVLDAGNLLVCRAGNPGIPDSMMEDAWKLEIHCK